MLESDVGADVSKQKPLTMARSWPHPQAADWHALDPENTLYLGLASGRVVIELAPSFAPLHVVNVKALAREQLTMMACR